MAPTLESSPVFVAILLTQNSDPVTLVNMLNEQAAKGYDFVEIFSPTPHRVRHRYCLFHKRSASDISDLCGLLRTALGGPTPEAKPEVEEQQGEDEEGEEDDAPDDAPETAPPAGEGEVGTAAEEAKPETTKAEEKKPASKPGARKTRATSTRKPRARTTRKAKA